MPDGVAAESIYITNVRATKRIGTTRRVVGNVARSDAIQTRNPRALLCIEAAVLAKLPHPRPVRRQRRLALVFGEVFTNLVQDIWIGGIWFQVATGRHAAGSPKRIWLACQARYPRWALVFAGSRERAVYFGGLAANRFTSSRRSAIGAAKTSLAKIDASIAFLQIRITACPGR